MGDLLNRVSGEQVTLLAFLVLVVGGGLLVGTIAIITTHLRQRRQAELDASLKEQMLTKGMQPAEIAEVLKAGAKKSGHEMLIEQNTVPAQNNLSGKAALVKLMLDYGKSGEDIARVLQALHGPAGQEEAAEPLSQEKEVLVKGMLDNDMSGEDMERVLLALDARPAAAPPGKGKIMTRP